MEHSDDLCDDPAHRRTDDVGALDPFRVEDGDGVLGHARDVVRPRGRIGAPGSAVVERDAPVPTAECSALQAPPAMVDAETLDQEDGRALAASPYAVRDLDAVGC